MLTQKPKKPKNTHLNSNNTVIKKIEIQNVTLIFTEKNMYNSHLQKTSKNLYTAMKFTFQISILTTAFSLHYNNLSTNCAVLQSITMYCNVLQCITMYCNVLQSVTISVRSRKAHLLLGFVLTANKQCLNFIWGHYMSVNIKNNYMTEQVCTCNRNTIIEIICTFK